MKPEEVIAQVEASGLIGRGGAAFPTGLKWKFTRGAAGDIKYVVCNADESEPGTFKDRVLMEHRPHLLLEGIAAAALFSGRWFRTDISERFGWLFEPACLE